MLFSAPLETPLSTEKKVLKIGLLLPMTGNLSEQGQNQLAAIKMARDEANLFFDQLQAPYQISLELRDTEANPDKALQALKSLDKEGIQIVIGPASSESVRSCLSFAKQQEMVLISPSSTTPDLIGQKADNLFRLSPNDDLQGQAIASLIAKEGVESVVVISRGDIWGDSLLKSFKQHFQNLKGRVPTTLRYNPETTLFDNQLKHLKSALEQEQASANNTQIAVLLIGFEESVNVLEQASHDPYFSHFKWLGADAIAASPALLASSKASEFANLVKFRSPKIAIPEEAGAAYSHFKKNFYQLHGKIADPYVAAAYDALKLTAFAYPWVAHYPSAKLWKQALNYTSKNLTGLTGNLSLDTGGERVSARFDFWEVYRKGESFLWVSNNSFRRLATSKGEA